MADDPNPDPNPNPDDPNPNPNPGGDDKGPKTLEEAIALLNLQQAAATKARNEAKNLRDRLKPLEEEAKKRADADKTTADKLADAEKEKGTLAAQVAAMKAERALEKAGALDPELLAARISAEDVADPDKLNAAIEALKKSHPKQFGDGSEKKPGSVNGGRSGGAGGGTQNVNDMIRGLAGRG